MSKTNSNTSNNKQNKAKDSPNTEIAQNSQQATSTISVKTNQDGTVTIDIRQHHDGKGGHPHVMTGQVDNKLVSVGLTHDPKKSKNSANRKLTVNPLGKQEPSYMQRKATIDKPSSYGKEVRKGQLSNSDAKYAKKITKKAIEKYNAKKEKK